MATTTESLEIPARRYGPAGGYSDSSASVTSAVSWGAIAAGAAAGASLSLILLILGVGLGLSSVSPWATEGVSATAFGVSTIVWLTLTQLLSSAMGGYLAGRLRTKWADTHTDEVYFRDTAHGFLAWAVASLATAVLLTSAIGSILNGGIQAGASVTAGAVNAATAAAGDHAATGQESSADSASMAYFVDLLFRRSATAQASVSPGADPPTEVSERKVMKDTAEVARIFLSGGKSGPLPPEDTQYAAQLVAQHTGLSQQDAEKRVTAIHTRAQAKLHDAEVAVKTAAEKARKASAYAALWTFVSLLIGAFIASLAATFGGRQRDA